MTLATPASHSVEIRKATSMKAPKEKKAASGPQSRPIDMDRVRKIIDRHQSRPLIEGRAAEVILQEINDLK